MHTATAPHAQSPSPVVMATAPRRLAAVGIDIGVAVAAGAVASAAASAIGMGRAPALVVGGLALAVAVCWLAAAVARHGAAVGGRLVRVRRITESGMPGLRGTATVADLAAGRDPLALVPSHASAVGSAARPWDAQRHAVDALGLVADDHTWLAVSAPSILGRNPAAIGAALALPVTDLSRTLSKAHIRIEPAKGGLLVTDLGSTNGSRVLRDGGVVQLVPGSSALVEPGAVLELGDRQFRVDRRTRRTAPAAGEAA